MKTATSAMVLIGILVYLGAFVNHFLALHRAKMKKVAAERFVIVVGERFVMRGI